MMAVCLMETFSGSELVFIVVHFCFTVCLSFLNFYQLVDFSV